MKSLTLVSIPTRFPLKLRPRFSSTECTQEWDDIFSQFMRSESYWEVVSCVGENTNTGMGSTNVQVAKAGTGSGLNWTGINVAGSYTVVGTNATTSCSHAMLYLSSVLLVHCLQSFLLCQVIYFTQQTISLKMFGKE